MAEQEVKCPRCGRMVAVPTTGAKVRCPGCRQKFRFEVPKSSDALAVAQAPPVVPVPPAELLSHEAPTPPPAAAPAPQGQGDSGDRPLSIPGRAPGEGRPAPPPLLHAPGAKPVATAQGPPAAVNEVKCPRCGGMVAVPLSGEKVRCPGCRQKFRFEAPPPPPLCLAGRRQGEGLAAATPSSYFLSEREEGSSPSPLQQGGRVMEVEAPGIASPSAVLNAAAVAAPPAPTPAAADELRALWPALVALIHQAYERGRTDDEERLGFRAKADRAAALASAFLGPPASQSSVGHVFVTSVLPELTLNEVLGLSLEDYRHLDETLADAGRALEARLPQAAPAKTTRGAEAPPTIPAPPAQPPTPRRAKGLSAFEAAAAVISIAALAAVIVFFPEIKDFALKLQARPAPKNNGGNGEELPGTHDIVPPPDPSTRLPVKPRERRKRPDPATALKVTTAFPPVQPPEFLPPEPTPRPSTSVPVVPPTPEPPTPEPQPEPEPEPEPPPKPPNPWARLGVGAHRLFNGTDLKDWLVTGNWAVRGGAATAQAPKRTVAAIIAGNPEWRDYAVHARARIVRADRMTREDEYYLVILRYQDPGNFYCVRFPIEGIYEIGYYRNGRFHEVGRARHGLGSRFNQWRDLEVAIRGAQITVVIDNIRTGAPPWSIRGIDRGPVGVAVTGGEAAFEDVRVRVER